MAHSKNSELFEKIRQSSLISNHNLMLKMERNITGLIDVEILW